MQLINELQNEMFAVVEQVSDSAAEVLGRLAVELQDMVQRFKV
ncbi:MAG: hypothetical protein ACOZHQ_08285 [Thermodesulfobacteriota bacterium]